MTLFTNQKFLFFVGGAVAALVGKKALKSKAIHKLTVQGIAAGIKLQKDALEKIQNIKEEATDLYMDAHAHAESKE